MSTANAALGLTGSIREITSKLGLPRSTYYYQPKQPVKDWHLKNQIEATLHVHPSYGHKRLAIELNCNKKRVRRVMRLFGIKPYRKRGKRYHKPKETGLVYPNLIQTMPFPDRPNQIWVSDFTHISFHGKFLYLATIKDIFDRRIVGWSLLANHSLELIMLALIDAIEKHGRPRILHSDQGSEYKSKAYTEFAGSLNIQLSMSHKASPWENGYQESFYSHFKVEAADLNRFNTTGELVADIYRQIYYYNHYRIHSGLKMPPALFAELTSERVLLN